MICTLYNKNLYNKVRPCCALLCVKDYIKDTEVVYDNVKKIDPYLEKIYNREELERLLK